MVRKKHVAREREDRRRLVELILTAGSVLGIITAFLHPNNSAADVLFTVTIVFFIIVSVRVYIALLTNTATGKRYAAFVALMAGAFWFLLAGVVEVVVLIAIDTTSAYFVAATASIYSAVALFGWFWVFLPMYEALTTTTNSGSV